MPVTTASSHPLFVEFWNLVEFYSAWELLLTTTVLFFACYGFMKFFFRKELRLYKNLKRPIMIFRSPGQDMEIELNLLRDSGYFKIPQEPFSNYQSADRLKGYGLIIIGYSNGMKDFEKIFDAAKNEKIPVIVYSKHMISKKIFNKLRKYSWYSTCQVPLRLMGDVFSILSTFPNPK